jgi:phosphohistidine phosphatase
MDVKYLHLSIVRQGEDWVRRGSLVPEPSAPAQDEKSLLEIFVLRHGEAGLKSDDPEKDDARPLTRDGRSEIEQIALSLHRLGVKIDLVASSPLPRSLQTAEIVARRYKLLNELEQWDELKPSGEIGASFRRLARLKTGSNLLIAGHEPQLSGMIGQIISGTSEVNLVLKKGGLAKLEILGFKPKVTGELRWLLTPRLLKRAGK